MKKMITTLSLLMLCSAGFIGADCGCDQKASSSTKMKSSFGKAQEFSDFKQSGESDDAAWDRVTAQDLVVVDFHATWCGPCKQFGPTFSSVAQDYKNVLFLKVDTGKHPSIASKYSVRGIPALRFLKNGQVVGSSTGALSASALKGKIKESLGV